MKIKNFDPNDWISPITAAKIRDCSRQAIHTLMKKGRFKVLEIDGIVFVLKKDVEDYTPINTGRPAIKK